MKGIGDAETSSRKTPAWRKLVLALLALCALAGAAGAQVAAHEAGSGQAAARREEVRAPFRAGEELEYRVRWSGMLNAAVVRMTVRRRLDFYGRDAWHLQAVGRTVDPVRLLYTLDDQFDSFSAAADLTSLQFETLIREQGETERSVARISTEGPASVGDGATAVRVPKGTRDGLGYLYYLRTIDWSKMRQARTPVYDGKKLYEVRARVETARGEAVVPAGTFTASRIELRVYEKDSEVAQTRFWVWLAEDAARTPVLIEAELPFGSLRVELREARR